MTVDKMSDSYKANIAYSKYSSKIKITPEGNSIVDENLLSMHMIQYLEKENIRKGKICIMDVKIILNIVKKKNL